MTATTITKAHLISSIIRPRALDFEPRSPSGIQAMTSQGTAHGRFQRAIRNRNLRNAEMAARAMGELSLPDALAFYLLLAASIRRASAVR